MDLTLVDVKMSSLAIAEITEKAHSNVVRDIRTMVDAIKDDSFLSHQLDQGLTQVLDNRGYTKEFLLNRFMSELLVTGYDVLRRARVLSRLSDLEKEVKLLKSKYEDRQHAKLEAPEMTEAIQDFYLTQGKEPKWFNYSNDFNMLNRMVLGCTSKKFKESHGLGDNDSIRDHLSPAQIAAVKDLQRHNTSLIAMGVCYEDRKNMLSEYFMRKHNKVLLDELLLLES